MYEHYLAHHGVPGMKWGVRKDRVKSSGSSRKSARAENKAIKKDRKQASKNRKKLSDAELKQRITRLENERKLKTLTDQDLKPGRTATKKFLSEQGGRLAKGLAGVAVSAATGAAAYYVKNKLSSKAPDYAGGSWKDLAAYVAPNPHKKK